jgi:diguanylate cyclase (GGDEF)-like protein/PAS domain S-box-containing protein
VKSVLLAEASQTRRRALSALLAPRGYAITALPDLDEAYRALQRSTAAAASYSAIVLGWPEFADGAAEDVFGLLHSERFEHLPVLILADSNSAAAVNWRMTRPGTALLQWSDYAEAAEALDQLLRPAQSAQPELGSGGSALRVLLVDDSPTVRVAFAKLLRKHDYEVEMASNVAEGLEKARGQAFDIAVVDYFMPGGNGTSLIAALKADPATEHVLSATITGTYSDAIITESLAAGAVECLFKSEAKELFLARLSSLARTVHDRKAIDAERKRLDGILSSVGDGVYGVDPEGRIEFINPAAIDLLGFSDASELIGRGAFESFHHTSEDGTPQPRASSYLNQCYADGSQVLAWQTVFWTAARKAIPVECTVYPLRVEGVRTGSVVAFRDISTRRALEDELRWQAEHDALTKLHNRAWFEAQLEQEINRLKRSEQTSVLLFVDLDRFKYINDTAGHTAGDQLLLEVSARLKSRLRASDHIARMGGDEYAVILRNVNAEDIAGLADGFRRALTSAPFVYAGKSYRITLSIGAARMDRNTASLSEAMAHADIACHIAKNSGRNQTHVYTPELGRKAAMDEDLGWSARLEEALRSDRFVLCFQPIVPLKGLEQESYPAGERGLWKRQFDRNPNSAMLYEVLLRLRDAQGELIPPNSFLPTAERFGLMADIDRWVIDRSLRALREARAQESRPIMLSINLSAQGLASPGLAAYVTSKVVEHNVDPALLVFEITESHSITDVTKVQALLHELRQLGCRIAVDDFGTGFSTFSYLRQLEADILKIDGSLIAGLPDDRLDRTVVASLVNIARSAGKLTVAECVENSAALFTLLECGVDYVQGHSVGMPRLQLAASASLSVVESGHPPRAAAG